MTGSRACPSCAGTMQSRKLERQITGQIELDVCFDCHVIWFDQYESGQLAPGAVIELFRMIHEQNDKVARPLADRLACIHCREKLAFTNDVQRSNRISYYRCAQGHGRLTTFVQFLREKNFVRTLSVPEIQALKATVKQVRCSSCGAAVDLARDAACAHCRAPIAILDGEAVQRALADLDAKSRGRMNPDAARIAEVMVPARIAQAETRARRFEHRPIGGLPGVLTTTHNEGSNLLDLVAEGIDALFD
jgi:Zn-finger nucleic acid-binding protein